MARQPFYGFRLPAKLVEELELTAKENGLTRQQAVIEAFELWLNSLPQRNNK